MSRVVGLALAASLLAPLAGRAGAEEIMVKGMGRSLGWLVAGEQGALGFRDCGGRLFAIGDGGVEPAKRRCPKSPPGITAQGVVAAYDQKTLLLTIETQGGQPVGFYLSGSGVNAASLTALAAGRKVRVSGPVAGRATRLDLE